MADVLASLERMSVLVTELEVIVEGGRAKLVSGEKTKACVMSLAREFYEFVMHELTAVQARAGLTDEIDYVVRTLLGLSNSPRNRLAYRRQLTEIKPYIQEAMIDVMKSRSVRLVVSDIERAVLSTLAKMLPATAVSYEQVLIDIGHGKRVSWRGTATELREVLREVMDHLAPNDKVMAAQGFTLEKDRTRPTQRQKVKFILKARRSNSTAVATAEQALETFEDGIATLARSTYDRGSSSTHTATDGTELRKLKHYVDAVLVELLEINV